MFPIVEAPNCWTCNGLANETDAELNKQLLLECDGDPAATCRALPYTHWIAAAATAGITA
jgi:hypothetical protein